MAAINVDKMSLKALVALEEKIQGAIAEARTKERAELKNKVAELAASHGFSVGELFGGRGYAKSKAIGIAKYANPDDATDTWSGRGRRPFWVVARLKKGADLADFEI
jgi:DNA-binding protein H-NS